MLAGKFAWQLPDATALSLHCAENRHITESTLPESVGCVCFEA